MYRNPKGIFYLILVLSFLALLIDLPKIPVKFSYKDMKVDTTIGGYSLEFLGSKFKRDLSLKKGLDLAGGVHVLLEADTSKIVAEDKKQALDSVKNVIERRVNLFGVSEPVVQTSKLGDSYRVIVELPGVYNTEDALSLIGKTAELKFMQLKDVTAQTITSIADLEETNLNGKDLKKAFVSFGQTNEPEVSIEFSADGAKKFAEITKRNLQKPLPVFLDNTVVTSPTVQTVISDGRAVITGTFTLDEAKSLAIQLNAGALPVPVKVIEQRVVGATLGEDSVRRSLVAGFLGLGLVAFFMIGYYRRLGILAVCALLVYGLLTLAIYKLVPIVLTLPGLAGFILSIGMAVDSNILIFERIKEELRMEKPLGLAMELGFGRAWDSIRDANVSTLITCFILFNPFNFSFLIESGPVRGFALTLALGVALSLFTGIVVTRNLIRVFYNKI